MDIINKFARESSYLKNIQKYQSGSYEERVNTQLFLIDVYNKKLEYLKNKKEKNKETVKEIEHIEYFLKSCKVSLRYLKNLDKNREELVKIINGTFRLK